MTSYIIVAMMFLYIVDVTIYVKSMINKKTIPSITTWVLLAAISAIVAASTFAENDFIVTTSLSYPVLLFIGQIIVAGFALRYGKKTFSRLDASVIGICIAAVVIWLYSQNPFYGLLGAITADFAAFLPTLIKTYKYPRQESLSAWILTIIIAVLSLFTIEYIFSQDGIFGMYMVVANGILLAFILRRWRI